MEFDVNNGCVCFGWLLTVMADYVYHNDSLPLGGSFYHSPAAGWFYVVVTDSESPGPRQPVSNWMPRSGLVTYGVLLTISAAIVNMLLCLVNLRRHRRDNEVSTTRFDDTGSSSITMTSSSSFRRPAIINFVVVQLAIGIVVVPVKVMTDTMGVWTIGGTACRAYLLGQVRLIAFTSGQSRMLATDIATIISSKNLGIVPTRLLCLKWRETDSLGEIHTKHARLSFVI